VLHGVVIAVIASAIFAVSTVLQQRGGLAAPPISLARPASFLALGKQKWLLIGLAMLIPGWILQALALGKGSVAVIQPIFTIGIVFTLPLGRWLNHVPVTRRQIVLACVVVAGIILYTALGKPGQGNSDAPTAQWAVAIAIITVACAGLLLLGKGGNVARRAGTYGSASGIVNGLAATLTKPVTGSLSTGGISAMLTNWQFWVVIGAGVLGFLFLQVALQTAQLAPAIATGSVTNPLTAVLLGIVLLNELLEGHRALAFASLGVALTAAILISLSREEANVEGQHPAHGRNRTAEAAAT
jgi:drug/metabolite transporter (DMT)-like permease